ELCRVAAEKKLIVGLFGGQEGIAKKTKAVLEQKFSGIKILFAIDGDLTEPLKPVDFLFVGLGHPKQEKFLYSLCHSGARRAIESSKKEDPIASLQGDMFKIGMGVGGSFDFISGNLPRPPWLIRQLGLGWLYRGFTKPGHWKRIFKALVIFPLYLLKSKYG
ncbi:MAG: WecB/TagA/CpsF family glycosyltransferase, partial [bacterium]|nr:WecB/TagA/CpsF family glycosyltransferase [bacterium]